MHCIFLCKCTSTTFENQVAGVILPEAHFLLWKIQSDMGGGTAQTKGPPCQVCDFLLFQQMSWLERQGMGAGNQKVASVLCWQE